MRVTKTTKGLKLHAVAGTYVVMLGFDLPQRSCNGLKGFSIHRVDHTEDEAKYLEGMKAFAETDPGFPAGATYSTKDQPIQSFQWSDYSAKPGHDYTYTIAALKGTPTDLKIFAETSVDITTESPEGGDQDVYFNRGVAASQEYARRFGNRAPDKVPNNQAFIWLSRGLYEALEGYVESCGRGDRLRIAAYEFHYEPFLKLLKKAKRRGVDVKVVFDKRKAKPGKNNTKAIKDTGIGAFCTPRKNGKSYISHNKFIVKMKGNKARSVWTGGTNFSSGGIFGHSNVGHLVEDPAVAERYLTYWNMLAEDPDTPEARDRVEEITKVPKLPPPKGTSVIFSPRNGLEALQYYAKLAASADHALFMTFAFGINKLFKEVYRTSRAPFRMALLEKATRPMKEGPDKKKEEQDIQRLRNMPENTFAIGDFIRTTAIDGWLKEKLSGLNSNVRYVHDKFMLVDPLSDDPIVVAGSANFSDASTTNNDENMIVVRGNRRIADIYFGEYMRLYSHHAFRESLKWRDANKPPKPLELGDWWRDYFGTTERSVRRRYFARLSR
ncbi:phospholipase D-like domain-containing protein [Bradyrhizobium septentrionale]|uniref:Phospholipase D n=1 Tax=Bradyrhizobium septentrionale TaxID=1404411 RepID=A0A974A0G7_9BRAD|nr:phospholipase D-like domain-containing protein [Bradyrhizobium septentrionale]UGY14061.1 phospholipase D-like domain-containing protein [Bradyrhizobium septentrionale]